MPTNPSPTSLVTLHHFISPPNGSSSPTAAITALPRLTSSLLHHPTMEQPNPPPLPVPAILPSCHPHPRSHSNSNTGLLITSTSTAHSNKRRRTNTGNPTYFDPTALHEFVEPQNINTDSTAEALYRFATNIKRVISDAVALTRSSSLEIRVKVSFHISLSFSTAPSLTSLLHTSSSSPSKNDVCRKSPSLRWT